MAPEPHLPGPGHPHEQSAPDRAAAADPAGERKTTAAPRRSCWQPRPPGLPDAGPLGADIASFRLHLAAEGKSARTVQGYTCAVRWFAADWLLGHEGKTSWEQADARDIQQWMVHLLDRYSSAYASIQFRALRQFFKWRAAEDQCPDPMTRLRAPKVTVTAVPVFTSGELSELARACQGRSFAARRDAAIIACSPPPASASQSWPGSAATPATRPAATWTCTAARSGSAARAGRPGLSRSATRRPAAWTATCGPAPGTRKPGGPSCGSASTAGAPLTAGGIYQAVARRGRQCGVTVYPHRFRHHFSHTWLDRGGAERDLMELNGWTSPQILTRYGASARGARARRSYDRIMDDTT